MVITNLRQLITGDYGETHRLGDDGIASEEPHAIVILTSRLPKHSAQRPHAAKLMRIELRAVLLCEIVRLLIRPHISSEQLDRIDSFIKLWTKHVIQVHVSCK